MKLDMRGWTPPTPFIYPDDQTEGPSAIAANSRSRFDGPFVLQELAVASMAMTLAQARGILSEYSPAEVDEMKRDLALMGFG